MNAPKIRIQICKLIPKTSEIVRIYFRANGKTVFAFTDKILPVDSHGFFKFEDIRLQYIESFLLTNELRGKSH